MTLSAAAPTRLLFRFALRSPSSMLLALTLIGLAALPGCSIPGPGMRSAALPRIETRMTVEPKMNGESWIARDGAALPMRSWLPEGEPKAVLVALHGFNDYSNAFAGAAPEWAEQGVATYAYDQRGFGRAPGRGLWPGSDLLIDDVGDFARLVAMRHPDVPLYLLGESMGGAAVMSLLADRDPPKVAGAVLVAPAVWGEQTMNPFYRMALWLGSRVMPGAKFTGKGAKRRPSDNIDMLRGLGRDPLVIKETRADAVAGLVDLMGRALDAAPRIRAPTLVLYGAKEEIVAPHAVKAGLQRMSRGPHRVAIYPEGYHMLLRDLNGPLVRRDVLAWVLDRAAPLPSGFDRPRQTATAPRPVEALAAP